MRVLFSTLCLLVLAVPSLGQCNTAPQATSGSVDAFDDALVLDILALASDPEGQPLSVSATTTCPAIVTVDEFDLVHFTPNSAIRADCQVNYTVTDELGSDDTETVSVKVISGIFADGFESGNTSAWSETFN